MKPRQTGQRKRIPRDYQDPVPGRRSRPLLSVRSALVFELALLVAIGGAGLLYLAHRSPAQLTLGGLGIFALALKFFAEMIE
jgi:hypothetical protein